MKFKVENSEKIEDDKDFQKLPKKTQVRIWRRLEWLEGLDVNSLVPRNDMEYIDKGLYELKFSTQPLVRIFGVFTDTGAFQVWKVIKKQNKKQQDKEIKKILNKV